MLEHHWTVLTFAMCIHSQLWHDVFQDSNTEWAMSYLVFEVSPHWTPIPGNDGKNPPDSWLCFIWMLNERRKIEGQWCGGLLSERRHKHHQCERLSWAWHHNKYFKNGNKSSHLDPPTMSPWRYIPCQGHSKVNVRKVDYKVLWSQRGNITNFCSLKKQTLQTFVMKMQILVAYH